MKFTKDWKKLDYPIFTTIRQDKGYYDIGQTINIETPTKKFQAEVVSIRRMTKNDITNTIAYRDADCSKEEFNELLYRFYKNNVGDLIMLILMRTK
jgi:hypothetical protein